MPFNRDSRQTLIDRCAGDIEARVEGADARLPRNLFDILAVVWGAGFDGAHGHLDFIAKQVFPWSMEDEFADRYASWWDRQRKLPTAATGPASATGSDGATIDAGSVLQRSDGFQYTVTADATLDGGATITLLASQPGSIGSAPAGTKLTFISPIENVNSTVIVAAPGLVGADAETTEAMMGRVEDVVHSPPEGGNAADYVEWATEQPGVTRAWTVPLWMGPGTVGVAIVNDNLSDIIPTSDVVDAVQAAIDVLRPVRATTYVFAPTAAPIDLTISIAPSNADTKAAVTAQLADLIAREAVVAGAIDPDSMATLDGGIYLSHLRDAVQTAAGIIDSNITSPAASRIVPTRGQILTLGTITWAA
jgi:uncharacterized phage protein gp47/JayE